jgi:RimJ/RimL family protein N-acetyltransferase
MIQPLFDGEKVRLSSLDLDQDSPLISAWSHDVDYLALIDSAPARPLSISQVKKKFHSEESGNSHIINFGLRTRTDFRLVGTAGFNQIDYPNGNAWLLLGIGEPRDRKQGYGSDAMRLLLKFAFFELNLYRLSALTFEYNITAQNLLERNGFRLEVRQRQAIHRFERRWDALIFGILREEWIQLQSEGQVQ